MANLKMIRLQSRIDELFKGKIDLNDTNSSDQHNIFFTRAIAALAITMRCGIEYDIAAKCITDGFNDMGIDAIYNDTIQKKLVIVQSKWRADGQKGIAQEESHKFAEGVSRLLVLDFEDCNSKLKEKEQEISSIVTDMGYQIEMVICHTSSQSMSDYAMRPINKLLKSVNEGDTTELLGFIEINFQDLYEYLANGQTNDNIVIDDVALNNWGIVTEPYKAFYGTISVSAVGDWYKRFGARLFNKNIRYYKGDTEVNQGIRDVLQNEPDKFFYYNNGIKLLCKKITRKALYSTSNEIGLFVLEGVSIVNGAQTTGVIGSLFLEAPDKIKSAKIFIQMIDLGGANDEQSTQITKLSNTQNRIDSRDFAALDPNQERLRIELGLGGIQYFYKSGAKVDEPEHQITLDETIIAQACLSTDPAILANVKGNIGALTENIEKKPYILLFNSATNSFSIYNGVQVLRAVDNCIKKEMLTSSANSRKKLVLIHGNRLLLHLILKKIKTSDGFETRYLKQDDVIPVVTDLFCVMWDKIYNTMEDNFPEAYPAHIFKNVGRIKKFL